MHLCTKFTSKCHLLTPFACPAAFCDAAATDCNCAACRPGFGGASCTKCTLNRCGLTCVAANPAVTAPQPVGLDLVAPHAPSAARAPTRVAAGPVTAAGHVSAALQAPPALRGQR
jgi:hypothetical protein